MALFIEPLTYTMNKIKKIICGKYDIGFIAFQNNMYLFIYLYKIIEIQIWEIFNKHI